MSERRLRVSIPLTLRIITLVFVGAIAVDLLSKQWAVVHANVLIFNASPSELPLRLLMSLVAIAVGFVLARVATQRGLGRQWGVWIGCALLVAGILANGISPLLWTQGVPDFIAVNGGWVWNVADFEIAIGLTGGILSVAFCAVVVYARERVARGRA
jgi:Signal peptidase (SPase) II